MRFGTRLLAVVMLLAGCVGPVLAGEPAAKVVAFHGYSEAIELRLDKTRVVLCPQAGGRVLEFSVDGVDAMWLE